MTRFSIILAMVAIIFMIVNPTNAAPTRGIRAAESLDSMANSNTSIIINDLLSHINPAFVADVLEYTELSAPTHDSVQGSCDEAKDDTELSTLISNESDGDEIRLCPGKINFQDEIVLTKSIAISCAGPKNSCILDGNKDTRHFRSTTGDLTFVFTDLTFINGFADDGSGGRAEGGSLFLKGSTTFLDGCLFYNNRALSSSDSARGGAIFAFNNMAFNDGETVVNNCLFIDNSAVTTKAGDTTISAEGGAIRSSSNSNLKVTNSIFKKNKALQVNTADRGGGGAIRTFNADVLVLSSVFELNEASNNGGAALFNGEQSVDWYNNKELLFGNDAGGNCDGVDGVGNVCFSVGDNFSD